MAALDTPTYESTKAVAAELDKAEALEFDAGRPYQLLVAEAEARARFEEEQMPKKTKKKPEEFDVKFKNPLGESNDAEQDAKQTEEPQLSPKKLSKKGKKNGSEKKKGPSGVSRSNLCSWLTAALTTAGLRLSLRPRSEMLRQQVARTRPKQLVKFY